MSVLLTIDGQMFRPETEVISIGRGPANQVSLPNDARLAAEQAVLRNVAGRWIVESRDGGLIRVGNGRPTQFAWLNPGDVIHLTDAGPAMVFTPQVQGASVPQVATSAPSSIVPEADSPRPQLTAPQPAIGNSTAIPSTEPSRAASASSDIRNPDSRSEAARIPSWILFAGLGGLATLLLIGSVVYFSGRGRSVGNTAIASAPSNSNSDASPPITGAATTTTDLSLSQAKPGAADPRRALYCLELRTADRKRTVQIGSAWAVAPRRLVTTGDAARGIALNQEFFPDAFARHTMTGEEFEIKGMSLHPQYESAARRLEQALRDLQRLKGEFERATDSADRKKIEALLHKLDSEAIIAADESVNVNFALLDVAQDVPSRLDFALTPVMKVGQQLTLVGHPLPRAEQLVDPDHPVPVQLSIGRLQHTDSVFGPAVPARCLVRFDDALKGQNWSGSPVLNSEGVVIGLYIRVTPPPPGTSATPIATHDVSLISGARDLFNSMELK